MMLFIIGIAAGTIVGFVIGTEVAARQWRKVVKKTRDLYMGPMGTKH